MSELRDICDDPSENQNENDNLDDNLSYGSSQDLKVAPVKFVSTRSSHNFYGSESDFPLHATHSFTSMMLDSHDDEVSHHSRDSLVQTGVRVERNDSPYTHHSQNISSPVNFTMKDVSDLRNYVESIEYSQKQIRKILSKLDPERSLQSME